MALQAHRVRSRFLSLRLRLVRVLLLAVALPAVGLSAVMGVVVTGLVRDNAEAILNELTDQIAARMTGYIGDLSTMSLHTVYSTAIQSYLAGGRVTQSDVLQPISQAVEMKQRSFGAYLYAIGGTAAPVLVNYKAALDYRYDATGDPFVGRILEGSQPFGLAGARRDPQSRAGAEWVVTAYRLVHDLESGDLIGLLLMNIPFSTLDGAFQGLVRSRGASVTLADSQERLVYSLEPAEPISGPRVVARRALAQTGWTVRIAMPLAALAVGFSALGLGIVIPSAAVAAAALILSFLLPLRITRPLAELSNDMDRLKRGDFDVQSAHDAGDEIGELSRNFRDMAVKLDSLVQRVAEEEHLRSRAEMAALQSQINPHFLYNTVNTVKWLAHFHGSPSIAEVADCLMHMMRYAMKQQDRLVQLSEELENLRHYLRIQEIRYFHAVEVRLSCPESCLDIQVPKLTLQPLLENVFQHAVPELEDGARVELEVRDEGTDVVLVVRDNAGALDADTALRVATGLDQGSAQGHVGLASVHRRIRTAFGPSYGLGIHASPGVCTEISVRLPRTTVEVESNA